MSTNKPMDVDLDGFLKNLSAPKLAQKERDAFLDRLEGQKNAILAALDDGRAQGKPDDMTLTPEKAWEQIVSRARSLHAMMRGPQKQKDGNRTDAFVALFAPIYRRYAGKAPAASQGRVNKGQGERAGGPFPRLVCAVAGAFDLPATLTPDAVDAAIKRLKNHNPRGEDDARADAQAIFQSTHTLMPERFAPAIAQLLAECEKTLSPEGFAELKTIIEDDLKHT